MCVPAGDRLVRRRFPALALAVENLLVPAVVILVPAVIVQLTKARRKAEPNLQKCGKVTLPPRLRRYGFSLKRRNCRCRTVTSTLPCNEQTCLQNARLRRQHGKFYADSFVSALLLPQLRLPRTRGVFHSLFRPQRLQSLLMTLILIGLRRLSHQQALHLHLALWDIYQK